jgi:hypothetical protein
MNQEEISKMKKDRERDVRIMKDRTASIVARMSLPSIVLMVGVLVFSAQTLPPEAIAVVASLVTACVTALIQVLHKTTGAEKEDPMLAIAKDLISHLTEENTKEIYMNDKGIKIVGNSSKMVAGKDLIWGDDKPPKGKK